MAKKTKKKEQSEEDLIETYLPCEWVIQFDDDEPQIFAVADETVPTPEVIIKLQNTNRAHITFADSKTGKSFRMFARAKQQS